MSGSAHYHCCFAAPGAGWWALSNDRPVPRPVEWRLRHQVTQVDLATLLDVDLRTVQRWETGESLPRQERWPQFEAFDRGDLILVRPPDGPIRFAPAADHVAWRRAGAVIRRTGTPASPVQRAEAAIGDVRDVDEIRAIIELLQGRLQDLEDASEDGVHSAAPNRLTISSQENTLAPEVDVSQITSATSATGASDPNATPAATPRRRRGPGRPRVADTLVTYTIQVAEEHDAALQALMGQGLSRGAAVRTLIGRAMGRRWHEDPSPDTSQG